MLNSAIEQAISEATEQQIRNALRLEVTLSNMFAFLVANAFSYVANSRLTFKAALSLNRYIRFFLASILLLGFTLLISWTAERYGLHYLSGFALIVILVPLFSYLVMKFWAFDGIQNSVTGKKTR